MKRIQEYIIESNRKLTNSIYEMVMKGDTSWIINPGQFMEITVKNAYLKRPISICDSDDSTITIIYKVVGKGTDYLSTLQKGDSLEALIGLGNGFDLSELNSEILLIGGGVGIPPLYAVCKKAISMNKQVKVILGYRTVDEAYYIEKFKKLGAEVLICSDDGSLGSKGTVVNVIESNNLKAMDYCTCGPIKMMEAIHKVSNGHGLLSFEARMGCGFGACMGCSTKTKNGYKRICKEGPILDSEEVLWED